MTLLDGKAVSEKIKSALSRAAAAIRANGGKAPHLAALLVGGDGASETYVGSKIKACEKIGFRSSLIRMKDTVTQDELLHKINEVNRDPEIDGLIVQLPLPGHLSSALVCETVWPSKDVDGFHPVNVGRMAQGRPCFVPATPKGILLLLEEYGIVTEGRHCVILGRSNIVGTPLSLLLSRNSYPGNCTVTVCHSKTRHLEAICREADLLIAALGQPGFVTSGMVKEGAVVVDVGITRVPDAAAPRGYRIAGDVLFDDVAPHCSFLTPVPGGVGPMTIAGLLLNTLSAARKEIAF